MPLRCYPKDLMTKGVDRRDMQVKRERNPQQ